MGVWRLSGRQVRGRCTDFGTIPLHRLVVASLTLAALTISIGALQNMIVLRESKPAFARQLAFLLGKAVER
ncbi:MAG TPA: hypothetical protein VIY51_18230 [Xanthobacteraceae bacterium]